MAAGKTTYARSVVVNATLRGVAFVPPAAVYVALHYADPTEAGNAYELAGGGYARRPVTFGAPNPAGVCSNSAEVLFPEAAADWLIVTHFSLWDEASGGNCWYQGELSAPVQVEEGEIGRAPAGMLTVAEK